MTDEAALLAAICERPDDDDARLVYADWLSERGDPRGEFIQLQCQTTRTADLRAREKELLAAHRAAWTAHLPEWARETAYFDRGIVHQVSIPSLDHFFADARELLALSPRPTFGLSTNGSIRMSPDESLALVLTTTSEVTESGRTSYGSGEDLFVVLEMATFQERYRRAFSWWWTDAGNGDASDRFHGDFRADGRAVVYTHKGQPRHEDPIP